MPSSCKRFNYDFERLIHGFHAVLRKFREVLHRLCGVVVVLPCREQEVRESIPGRVIPNNVKIVVMAALLGAQECGVMTD